MDLGHLRRILDSGRWSVTYSPTFVKQVAKAKKVSARAVGPTHELPGEALSAADPVFGHLLRLCDVRGWHSQDGLGINVAHGAKSFRTPEPRFSAAELPLRTSFARVELPSGQLQWRVLERDLEYAELPNQHQLLPERVPILVTVFSRGSGP